MASTNKHKSYGKKKPEVKAVWWTKERIKAVVSVVAVLIVVAIGVAVFRYVDHKQDSLVGAWNCTYEDPASGDGMDLTFTFAADNSVTILRNRNGEQEEEMTGTYSVDDQWNIVTVLLPNGDRMSATSYDYKCKHGKLTMTDALQRTDFVYNCTKVQ